MAPIPDEPIRICFVCLGNICRSPTAEGVMRHLLVDAGLDDLVEVDSAGTGGWHVGDPPDERATAEAARRGIDLTTQRARRFHPGDLDRYDLVVSVDESNLTVMRDAATEAHHHERLHLLRSFDPDAADPAPDVPDPYYGGPDGFADVFDLVEVACRGLLEHLHDDHDLPRPSPR